MSLEVCIAKGRDNFCGECRNFIPAGAEAVGHGDIEEKIVHLVHLHCAEKRNKGDDPRCSLCAKEITHLSEK